MATHQEQAVIKLREMILNGTVCAGQRVTETALSEKLLISRTPVRYAITVLEQEGLLTKLDRRGYAVSTFNVADVLGAIDVRGALEGLAARILAEAGVSDTLGRQFKECLEIGDAIFAKGHLAGGDEAKYAEMNQRFHGLITQESHNRSLNHILALNGSFPFSGAGAFAFGNSDLTYRFRTLNYAHLQHHAIVKALENGESARAEALMREHTNAAKESSNLAGDTLFDASGLPDSRL